MSVEQKDLDVRLARIADQLALLGTVSAEAREEALGAAEQLIEHALTSSRQAVVASELARTERTRQQKRYR